MIPNVQSRFVVRMCCASSPFGFEATARFTAWLQVPDRLKSGAAHEMHIVLHDAHGNPGARSLVPVVTAGCSEA